ncbi:MAG: hypothetical protein K2Q01_01265, partial [Rickettsiales bacterium]|nr:hypothetical protein [Rickettsiales bacterium]
VHFQHAGHLLKHFAHARFFRILLHPETSSPELLSVFFWEFALTIRPSLISINLITLPCSVKKCPPIHMGGQGLGVNVQKAPPKTLLIRANPGSSGAFEYNV